MRVVALQLLLDLEVFVGQRLAHLLRLEAQHLLESVFFGAQRRNLLLVVVQLFGQRANQVLQISASRQLQLRKAVAER